MLNSLMDDGHWWFDPLFGALSRGIVSRDTWIGALKISGVPVRAAGM
jgi:hypothetical protein